MSARLGVWLDLTGRDVLIVGGGAVAAAKLGPLLEAGARVTVVAPSVRDEAAARGVTVHLRPFAEADLDGKWLVVAAATPEVNRRVEEAAAARRIFVNSVDDPARAAVHFGATFRRGGVAVSVSTGGVSPALAALVRDTLSDLLPDEAALAAFVRTARELREEWRASGLPVEERRARLRARLARSSGA